MRLAMLLSMLGVVTVVTVVTTGCGASGEDTGGTDDHLETKPAATAKPKGPLTDAELAAALAAAPKSLSEEDAAALVRQTLSPLATTPRLKLLNDFIAKAPESDGKFFLAGAMEGIWWATPRDLVSTPAGFGGQTLTTTVTVDAGIAGPSRLTIKGDAKTEYTLDLMVSTVKVSGIKIPAGTKASAAAKIIAKALDAKNAQLLEATGGEKTFDAIGGDHSDSPSGVDDVEISTSGGAVVVLVAQNG